MFFLIVWKFCFHIVFTAKHPSTQYVDWKWKSNKNTFFDAAHCILLINRLKQFKKYFDFDENIIHKRLVQSSKRIRWHYRTESKFRLTVRKIDVENCNSDFCLSRRRKSSALQFLRREISECSRDKKLFLETRPWYESLSRAKIMAQKTKIGKISTPTKGNHGYFLIHAYNPPADWSRDTAKNVPAIIVAGAGVKGF